MTIRGSIFLFILFLLIFTPPFFLPQRSKTQKFTEVRRKVAEAVPQESKVLGISKPTPQEEITQAPIQFVYCTGPDGKTVYAPQKDCDNVNSFWAANPPPKVNNNTTPQTSNSTLEQTNPSPSKSNTPTPSPTPSETPTVAVPTPTPTIAAPEPTEEVKEKPKKKKKKKDD